MFTGIVEEMGIVQSSRRNKEGFRLSVKGTNVLEDMALGDSIAVNGICLTVTLLSGNGTFEVDVMPETMRNTNLIDLSPGSVVNLERAMSANGRFGGHFVSGHIDGRGNLISRRSEGNSVVLAFSAPAEITKYIIKKGSITIDGVSLTVTDVSPEGFIVSLVPHTLQNTILEKKKTGDIVNLEVDILGKYVEKYLEKHLGGKPSGGKRELTAEYLIEKGF